MHTVSFSPSGDVLAFAGESFSLVSVNIMLNVLPKVTIALLPSSTRVPVPRSM